MASFISRVTGSAASGTIDSTIALANLNFDFALYKIEAPKEYASIGTAISPLRKLEAETGLPHRTARKLGALFCKSLPSTPRLHQKYGLRCSEIIKFFSFDVKRPSEYGFLADQVGVDATSLWASATSSQQSISVHLLACLLARFWDTAEVTSIWVEIIAKRQEEIRRSFEENDTCDLALLNAASQQFNRVELADWDSSARAWLRSADAAKCRQQTQLKLITGNVRIPVHKTCDLYSSVMTVWKCSLEQLESLMSGMSLEIRSGDVLLALSAWHLYPDMVVLGLEQTTIQQKDDLFPTGALLTVGLHSQESWPDDGIFWSLPLAYLRCYGEPVLKTSSLKTNERLSMDELLQAVVCGYLMAWDVSEVRTVPALRLFVNVSERLLHSMQPELSMTRRFSWVQILSKAAQRQLEILTLKPTYARSLRNLGRRWGQNFLDRVGEPLFGFLNYNTFVNVARSEEDVVEVLRHYARKTGLNGNDLFIRYLPRRSPSTLQQVLEFVYTTAIPEVSQGRKRKADIAEEPNARHVRWIPNPLGSMSIDYSTRDAQAEYLSTHRRNLGNSPYIPNGTLPGAPTETLLSLEHLPQPASPEDNLLPKAVELHGYKTRRDWGFTLTFRRSKPDAERFVLLAGSIESHGLFVRLSATLPPSCSSFNHIETVKDVASIFSPARVDDGLLAQAFQAKLNAFPRSVTSVDSKYPNQRVVSELSRLDSLIALSAAAVLYDDLPGATIDVRCLQSRITANHWESATRERSYMETGFLPLASSFACIASFESGRFNLRPDQLTNVMAMSSGDSIFVADQLLRDPDPLGGSHNPLKRVPGNIGRAGIAFLVPPRDPLVKKFDEKNWQLINHEEFDGKIINSFAGTSLHLRFTKAEFPIDTGFTGAQDVEAFLIEGVVSVHDRGDWIADLDILKALESELLEDGLCHCALNAAANEYYSDQVAIVKPGSDIPEAQASKSRRESPASTHVRFVNADEYSESELGLPQSATLQRPESRAATISGSDPFPEIKIPEDFSSMIALDSWDEILSAPSLPGVIRADRNWQARLAAVALCVSRGHYTIVLSPEQCWRCAIGMVGRPATWEQSGPITMVVA